MIEAVLFGATCALCFLAGAYPNNRAGTVIRLLWLAAVVIALLRFAL